MSTVARIPLSEHLHEIYRPDRDYMDGEVQERNMSVPAIWSESC